MAATTERIGATTVESQGHFRSETPATALSTFDVFDTLLTRAVAEPSSAFYFLGKRAVAENIVDCTAEVFSRSRREAEHRLYAFKHREPSLAEIYGELGAALQLSEDQRQGLMTLELRTEESLIRAVPGARDKIQDAVSRGQAIVYLSDMYLPSRFIQEQLHKHELWVPAGRLFVSCEAQATKRTGALFQSALASIGMPCSSVTHCGNDPVSDVQMPKRLGINVQPYTSCNPNRYEKILESYHWETGGGSSLLAGASRLARLRVPVSNAREAILRDVAAGVGGPILTSYVLWVLQRAKQLSLDNLYFVSRDGHILLQIANKLAPHLGVTCKLRYLYGSREAWHAPALVTLDEKRLSLILESANFPSIEQLLRRVGLSPDQLQEPLRCCGFHKVDWHRPLERGERDRVLKILRSDPGVGDLLLQRATDKREVLLRYLSQEGLIQSRRAAIVDIGWFGRTLDSLASVLSTVDASVPRGFYFGLHSETFAAGEPQKEAYYFDKRIPGGFVSSPHGLANLMEVLCAAPHGQVVSYRSNGDGIIPVLRAESNPFAMDWGLGILQQTICEYAEELSSNVQLLSQACDLRPAIDALIRSFWVHPLRDEAAAWSSFRYFDDQDESTWNYLAEPYTLLEALKLLAGIKTRSLVAWQEGSLALSSRIVGNLAMMNERAYNNVRMAASKAKKIVKNTFAGGLVSAAF